MIIFFNVKQGNYDYNKRKKKKKGCKQLFLVEFLRAID